MRKLLCLLLVACALTMRVQNGIDEKKIAGIVRRFAPPSMVRQSAAHRHEFPLREDDETGRLDRSGKTYVVAAYANGLSAQVGDLQGNHRITKGSVSLNGVLFATASEFKSQPVARSVHLSQSNDVEVSIDGTRDQTHLVAVRPDVPDATQSLAPKATPVIH